jgi:hypothetical protein
LNGIRTYDLGLKTFKIGFWIRKLDYEFSVLGWDLIWFYRNTGVQGINNVFHIVNKVEKGILEFYTKW